MSELTSHGLPQRRFYITNWQIYLGILMINILVAWLFKKFIMTRDIYYNLLSEQIESYRIDQYVELMNRHSIWGFITIPITLFIKVLFISLLLQLPLLTKFVEISFTRIFRIVLLASISFCAGLVAQFVYIYSMPISEITANILIKYPLSLAQLVDIQKYNDSANIVFNSINVFEILWIFLIYKGLANTKRIKKIDSAILILGVWTVLLVLRWAVISYLYRMYS
jgi:hypothetical protein